MASDPQPARPEEWLDVFRLLFRHSTPEDREQRIANALTLLERGEMNPDGVFVLRDDGDLLGVLICLPLPGATALVWPPECREGLDQTAREDRLLQHAAGWLRRRGIKLAQTLLSPDSLDGAEVLERNGFVHLTHLWYLRHTLDVPLRCLATPARMQFDTVDNEPTGFADTLMRSYEGTLDCPEINDVRTVEEVLEGHRSQGVYDPRRWWLASIRDRPIGILLVCETPETREWDVAYVGVVPEARRQGFGRELMLKALFEARAAGAPGVTLSVDGRNHAARDLYRDLGFEVFDRREVFLAIWR